MASELIYKTDKNIPWFDFSTRSMMNIVNMAGLLLKKYELDEDVIISISLRNILVESLPKEIRQTLLEFIIAKVLDPENFKKK